MRSSSPRLSELAFLPKPRRGAFHFSKQLWIVAIILLAICGGLGTFVASRQAERARIAAEETRQQELKQIVSMTEKQASAKQEIVDALGEKPTVKNAKATVPITQDLNLNDTTVEADLVGSKGTAQLVINAKQVDATWQLTKVQATLPDGKKVAVELPAEDAAPELDFDTK